jgi:DNA-binding IclR family transcriptional regulator
MAATPLPGTQTLDRAFSLLRRIATGGQQGASLNMLCADTGWSRATTYRLLQALRRQGFVRPGIRRGHYLLGYELFALGAQAGDASGLRELARPALARLAQRFGDSFFLLVPDGYSVLCLEVMHGEHPVRSYSEAVGGRIPMGVGQGSQVLLASMGKRERLDILHHNAPTLLRGYGLEAEAIASTLDSVRRLGFARGIPDRRLPGYTGLAVPIVDAGGQVLGAFSCALARPRMTEAKSAVLAAAMMAEVRDLLGKAEGLLQL